MSEILAEATYLFTWRTAWLEPCDKCQRLNGRMYSEYTLDSEIIYDPEYGEIWNIQTDTPLTHPNCKCYLEVEIFVAVENSAPFRLLTKELQNFDRLMPMPSNIKEMSTLLDNYDRSLQRVERRMNNTRQEITRVLSLMNMMGLPPEAQKTIQVLGQLQIAYMQTRNAALALLVAADLSMGPMGYVKAGIDLGLAAGGWYSIAVTLAGQ